MCDDDNPKFHNSDDVIPFLFKSFFYCILIWLIWFFHAANQYKDHIIFKSFLIHILWNEYLLVVFC